MIDNQIVAYFQKKILDRYAEHARDLPWRKTQDPYKIWISESMLCQTQVSRVIGYYEKRLELFPNVEALANASNEDVLKARSGLGYNSRALRLKQAATQILNSELGIQNNGSNKESDYFPNTFEELIKLPGVGDYIANAILAFAYNQDVVVIDTNIRRIMIECFSASMPQCYNAVSGKGGKAEQDWLKEVVWQTLPKGNARTRYNALMDYGALELTSKKTGIKPLTKQSKFQGSVRQARAGIVKAILNSEGGMLNYSDIGKLYAEREDLDQIIEKMQKDGLIRVDGQTMSIKN